MKQPKTMADIWDGPIAEDRNPWNVSDIFDQLGDWIVLIPVGLVAFGLFQKLLGY